MDNKRNDELNTSAKMKFNPVVNLVNPRLTAQGQLTGIDRVSPVNKRENNEDIMEEKKGLTFGEVVAGLALGLFVLKVVVPAGKECAQTVKENWRKYLEAEKKRAIDRMRYERYVNTIQANKPIQALPIEPAKKQLPASEILSVQFSVPKVSIINQVPKLEVPVVLTQPQQIQSVSLKPKQSIYDVKSKWLDIIRHPCRITILGSPGSGKTFTAHFLAELLHLKMNVCLVGFPKDKIHLLPDWMEVEDNLDKVGPDTVVLIDEAYLTYPARDSQKKVSRDLSEPLGLFRQKRQTLIFVVQETRLVDINIVSSSDMLIIKNPSTLQTEFERPELKKILTKAKEALDKISGDMKNWAYVHCPWFEGVLEIPQVSYWIEDLSNAYAFGISGSGEKQSVCISLEEKRKEAKRLYATGKYSYQQLAKIFGRDKSTIIYWVKHCQQKL